MAQGAAAPINNPPMFTSPKNNQGNIWIKYSDSMSAVKAQDNLNGKYFDNVKIFCYFVTEKTYQDRVGI